MLLCNPFTYYPFSYLKINPLKKEELDQSRCTFKKAFGFLVSKGSQGEHLIFNFPTGSL